MPASCSPTTATTPSQKGSSRLVQTSYPVEPWLEDRNIVQGSATFLAPVRTRVSRQGERFAQRSPLEYDGLGRDIYESQSPYVRH